MQKITSKENKKHSENHEELNRIKKNIEQSYNYFRDNYKSFHDFRKFIFVSTLEPADISLLNALKKPVLEFNILEAYISRLLGEFVNQEPSISVSSKSLSPPDPLLVDIVEGHFRHILSDTESSGDTYEVMRDLFSGGFSVFKVETKYANNSTFDQDIKLSRVFDPTMCGFDPSARRQGKTDGRFCVEHFAVPREEAGQYGIDAKNIKFIRSDNIGGFQWSYQSQGEDILIIADYYEKIIEEEEIFLLSDGTIISSEKYNQTKRDIEKIRKKNKQEDNEDFMPVIENRRTVEKTKIFRTRLVENKIIEKIETDYKCLPLVFVDGNSIKYRESSSSIQKQCVRPFVYQAKGMQKLKNFSGQTLANELENLVQHKFMAPKEGIPTGEYQEAYRNVQQANLLVYNAFKDDNPEIPLPRPNEIMRSPVPPEVTNTFALADKTIQNVLGSYDAALGINDNEISGVALSQAAAYSNAASMPYIKGYIQGLSDAAQIIKHLIPLYYTTNRTLPVILKNGEKSFIKINDEELGAIKMDYNTDELNIEVKSGVNFEAQKSNTIKAIVELSNSMPILSEFFNSKGLPILIENLSNLRGGDRLSVLAKEFVEERQAASNAPKQPDPIAAQLMLEQEHLKLKEQQNKTETAIKSAQIELDAYGKETERLKLALNEQHRRKESKISLDKHHAEKARTMAELAIKSADLVHKHKKDQKLNPWEQYK